MTYARRVDENQAEIVRGLRKIGAFVQMLHTIGSGCPDLLVGWHQRWFLIEIKRDHKSKPNQWQLDYYALVAGRAPIFVVTSAMEAINFMQGMKP